jgi:hypothetical protein
VALWQAFIHGVIAPAVVAEILAKAPLLPDRIPDEQAYVDDQGDLVIYIDLPQGRISLSLPPGLWYWKDRN